MNHNRHSFLKTTGLGLMALASAVGALLPATSSAAGHRQPNVIIFLTDDQGTLDVNCYLRVGKPREENPRQMLVP